MEYEYKKDGDGTAGQLDRTRISRSRRNAEPDNLSLLAAGIGYAFYMRVAAHIQCSVDKSETMAETNRKQMITTRHERFSEECKLEAEQAVRDLGLHVKLEVTKRVAEIGRLQVEISRQELSSAEYETRRLQLTAPTAAALPSPGQPTGQETRGLDIESVARYANNFAGALTPAERPAFWDAWERQAMRLPREVGIALISRARELRGT